MKNTEQVQSFVEYFNLDPTKVKEIAKLIVKVCE